MSDPDGQELDAVDGLVRAYLDRVTERTDAARLRARVEAGLRQVTPGGAAAPRPGRSSGRWSRSLGWSLIAATLLLGGFFGGRYLRPNAASAATLLQQVRVTHAGGVDRCYRVHYAPDPRYWDRTKVLEGPSESVLWTRGDRFWSDCSIGEIRLSIGREADGTLWVSPSRDKGIRFEGPESRLPEGVAILCDINSMTVPALVEDVLADFDVRAEGPAPHEGGPTSLVWARLRPGRTHPLISAALLEIDARTDTVVRLVLWTVRDGRPGGTVTFTLLESDRKSDDQYRLESHLDPGAEIEIHRFGQDGDDGPEDAGKAR